MQRLEVSGAVRPIYGSLGIERLNGRFTSCGMRCCALGRVFSDVSKDLAP